MKNGIEICEYAPVWREELLDLYASVRWTSYTDKPGMLENAVRHSLKTLAARDEGTLVGLVRAVGDGHSILYVQDLLVRPGYQRRGIGKALLQTLDGMYPAVYQKVLLAQDEPATVGFYTACGFQRAADTGGTAFVKYTR